MNVEINPSVVERARVYAALGDPVRLAIVDMLATGDLSPTELRVALGVESNLLAHHLNVLEREQIIARSPSEGDGRRSYARLTASLVSQIVPARMIAASRIVFVCSANAARSQLAQALWNQVSSIPADSAGTHPADRVAPGAVAVAARHDLDLAGRSPRPVGEVVLSTDLIVTVCDRAHEEYLHGAMHWSVPDPVRIGTKKAFDDAFDELASRVIRLARHLQATA